MARRSIWNAIARRVMAIVIGLIAYSAFLPVGFSFSAFMLFRGAIWFSWDFFRAGMSDSEQSNPLVFEYLDYAIDFVPRGAERIWRRCKLLWLGQSPERTELLQNSQRFTTDLILAIVFYGFLYLVLVHGGMAGIAGWTKSVRAVPSFVFGFITVVLIGGYFGVKVVQYQWEQEDKRSNVVETNSRAPEKGS